MKLVYAETPATMGQDHSVDDSFLPEGVTHIISEYDPAQPITSEKNQKFIADIKDADIIINSYVDFQEELLDAMDHCKVISFQSTGYNAANLEYAAKKGVAVVSIRDYCTQETAENAIASMMCLQRNTINYNRAIQEDMHYGGLNYVQGPEVLYQTGQLKKIVVSFIGSHKVIENAINDGKLELEFVPQGTLAERLRAAGSGLGGFYTPTGVGTEVEQGKETKIIDGKKYIFEKPLRGNVALVKAYRADRMGNAVFKLTAANFNPWMATAADTVILEVEQLVEVGEIDPDDVQLPGFFVDYIVVKEGAMF